MRFEWSSRAPRSTVPVAVATVVMLQLLQALLGGPFGSAVQGEPALEATVLEEVARWRDAGGLGAGLAVDVSADGSRLLLVGYAGPDDVRVTDRGLAPVAVLEPGPAPFDVGGAVWAQTGGAAIVWGRADGADRDAVIAFEAPGYAPNATWAGSDLGGLVHVDAVCSFASDVIVAVAGRDANGTSRVNVLETATMALIQSTEYPSNATVVRICNDMRDMACVDALGGLGVFTSRNWTLLHRIEGAVPSPTAQCIVPDRAWALGGSDGSLSIWMYGHREPALRASVADAPVTGIAWAGSEERRLVTASPRPGGGTTLSVWRTVALPDGSEAIEADSHENVTGAVTMLAMDPSDRAVVLAALDDGTLVAYAIYIPPPPPPKVYNEAGDVVDMPGLDFTGMWERPSEGEPMLAFDLGRDGTRLLLAHWRAPDEVTVVRRAGKSFDALETVATLDLGQGLDVTGARWSRNDTWAAVWGRRSGSDKDEVLLFDAPAFASRRAIDLNGTDGMSAVFDLEFVRRDRYVALVGLDASGRPVLQLRRTADLGLATSVHLTAWSADVGYDGSDLVVVLPTGALEVRSSKDWSLTYNVTGLGADHTAADFSMTPGWLLCDAGGNCTALLGARRSVAATLPLGSYAAGAVWSRDVLGDLVAGTFGREGTPTLQAWRLYGDPASPNAVSPRMVARLNLTALPLAMEADPLFPGSVMVAMSDGTLRVYRLNETGERRWQPFEDLDWPEGTDGDGDGDGDDDGGGPSGPSPLLVLGALALVAVALAVAVRLLGRGDRRGGGGAVEGPEAHAEDGPPKG